MDFEQAERFALGFGLRASGFGFESLATTDWEAEAGAIYRSPQELILKPEA